MHKQLTMVLALTIAFATAAHADGDCDGLPITVDDFLVATVTLSGKPARLALDPIRNVLLDREFAKAADIELLDASQLGYEGDVVIGGAGAREQVPQFATRLRLATNEQDIELPPVVVVDLRGPLGPSFEKIDGLLGTDLFTGHVLEIDTTRGCMKLHEREDFELPAGVMTLERLRHRPVVDGMIEFPSGERHELRFLLDFGMVGGVRLSTRFVKEHGLAKRLPTTVPEHMETGLGGELRSLETVAVKLRVGSASWQDLPVRLARETEGADADPPWDALLGVSLLKTRRMLYDPSGNRFWLLPASE